MSCRRPQAGLGMNRGSADPTVCDGVAMRAIAGLSPVIGNQPNTGSRGFWLKLKPPSR
jgi:hypothetical protein